MLNAVDLLVAEYQTLKTEQSDRIKTRDGMVYATMVAAAAAGYVAIKEHLYDLLLAGAAAALILGWHYLGGDRKIILIRSYIRRTLGPRIAAALQVPPETVFAWETSTREWGLTLYRLTGLCVDLLLFVGPAVGVIPWWLTHRWDHTLSDPLLWACPALAALAAVVTVAAVAAALGRQPTTAGGTR